MTEEEQGGTYDADAAAIKAAIIIVACMLFSIVVKGF